MHLFPYHSAKKSQQDGKSTSPSRCALPCSLARTRTSGESAPLRAASSVKGKLTVYSFTQLVAHSLTVTRRIRCKIAVVASSEDDSSSNEQKVNKETKQQYFAALREKYQVQLNALQQMGFQDSDRKLLKKLDKFQGNLDLVLNFIITRKQRLAGVEPKY